MQRSIFQLKNATSEPGRFSLNICSFAKLIDIYHTQEASNRHNIVYALLSMSSDSYSLTNLSPNYTTPWNELFSQVIKFILSEQVSITTWDDNKVAVIKSNGYTLGEVSSIKSDNAQNNRLSIIISEYSSERLDQKKDRDYYWTRERSSECHWILQTPAKLIQKGDIVCLLQGATKPIIIRLYEDYFTIIAITITLLNIDLTNSKVNTWLGNLQLITEYPRNFLVIWDWKESSENLENKNNKYPLMSQILKTEKKDLGSWLMNIGNIFEDLKNYHKAAENITKALEAYKRNYGYEYLHRLTAMKHLASIYKKIDQSKEGEKLEVIADLLGQTGDYKQITKKGIKRLAKLYDQDVMAILLDRRGSEVIITEDVVRAAARNKENGKEVIALLLDRRGDQFAINTEIINAAAKNSQSGEKVMELLLNQRENQIVITEEIAKTAVRNKEKLGILLSSHTLPEARDEKEQ
ncbi:hypothetical protein GGI43DRAFT_49074 [Trichoderma evansii]